MRGALRGLLGEGWGVGRDEVWERTYMRKGLSLRY